LQYLEGRPIKAAVLHAMFSCPVVSNHGAFISDMAVALGQDRVSFIGIEGSVSVICFLEPSGIRFTKRNVIDILSYCDIPVPLYPV